MSNINNTKKQRYASVMSTSKHKGTIRLSDNPKPFQRKFTKGIKFP